MLYGNLELLTFLHKKVQSLSYNVYGYQCTYHENTRIMNSTVLSSLPSNYAYNAYNDECGQAD